MGYLIILHSDTTRGQELIQEAMALKERFNQSFILHGAGPISLAFALDGTGRPLTSARSSMGHCFFATTKAQDGSLDCILKTEYIPHVVKRLLSPDLCGQGACCVQAWSAASLLTLTQEE